MSNLKPFACTKSINISQLLRVPHYIRTSRMTIDYIGVLQYSEHKFKCISFYFIKMDKKNCLYVHEKKIKQYKIYNTNDITREHFLNAYVLYLIPKERKKNKE